MFARFLKTFFFMLQVVAVSLIIVAFSFVIFYSVLLLLLWTAAQLTLAVWLMPVWIVLSALVGVSFGIALGEAVFDAYWKRNNP